MTSATPLDDAQLADSVLPAGADPFILFEEWFAAAQVGEINDPNAMALAYDAALRDQIFPWYRSGVEQDTEARRVAAAHLAAEDPDGDSSDPRTFMRSVFREGLLPALRTDAVVLRAFFRTLNLLTTPDAMMKDTDVSARVLAAWQDRENRPAEPELGPKHRTDLLALLPA